MNSSVPQVRTDTRPAGVLDTLQAGFNLVNRNVWLLLFPLCIELFIWLGPQLVVGPLFDRLLNDATVLPGLDSGLTQSMEEARRTSQQFLGERQALTSFNVLLTLTLPMRLLTPAFAFEVPQGGMGPTVVLPSLGVAALSILAALGIGLIVATVYFGLMAAAVRDGRATLEGLRGSFVPTLFHLGALVLVVFAAIVGIVLPIEALLAVFSRTSPMAASIIGPLIVGVLIWLFIYLFFTVPAVLVSGSGPVDAAKHSFRVVRRNFWSSTGIIMLTIIISAGLSVIWSELANWSITRQELAPFLRWVGIGAAISGHIYITGGLLAACMTYYKERREVTNAQPSMA
jgi:hypothetical protein